MTDIDTWKEQLRAAARPEKVKILSSFFKTGPGEYGEGDIFIGLPVPDNRAISKHYHSLPLEQIAVMLHDPIHEFRLAGLLALVEAYKRARSYQPRCKEIANFYLANLSCCNNWDLVDLSAQYIIGEYMILTDDDSIARRLALSSNTWEQRIAITSTLALIRNYMFTTAIDIAEQLVNSPTDLLQKTTGWVLREVGKRDKQLLCGFLDHHAATMPRTALRYAIERFAADERKHYMALRHTTPTLP